MAHVAIKSLLSGVTSLATFSAAYYCWGDRGAIPYRLFFHPANLGISWGIWSLLLPDLPIWVPPRDVGHRKVESQLISSPIVGPSSAYIGIKIGKLDIPADIIFCICKKLKIKDLQNLRLVCKNLHQFIGQSKKAWVLETPPPLQDLHFSNISLPLVVLRFGKYTEGPYYQLRGGDFRIQNSTLQEVVFNDGNQKKYTIKQSRDNKELVVRNARGHLHWTLKPVASETFTVMQIMQSNTLLFLVAGTQSGVVYLWDLVSGALLCKLITVSKSVSSLNGKLLDKDKIGLKINEMLYSFEPRNGVSEYAQSFLS